MFLLLPLAAVATQVRAETSWFPKGRVFLPLTADPRETRFGVDLVDGGRVSARIGKEAGIVEWGGATPVRLAVDGMLWGWFDTLPGFNFPLETVDGSFGLSLQRAPGVWSWRARYGHVSGHFGDGTYDIEARRITYTREYFELAAQRAVNRQLRVYAEPSFLVHGVPHATSFALQLGGDWTLSRATTGAPARPYVAVDLRSKSENDYTVNQSYELGLRLGRIDASSGMSPFRISAGYETGVSERGQHWQEHEDYFRFGVSFDD